MPEIQVTIKDLEDKEGEFAELFARYDRDKDYYFLKPFKMKTFSGREAKRVDNITLPDPLIFVNRVMGLLSSADPQTEIVGQGMTDAESSEIEDFLDSIGFEIDSRLIKTGRTPLFRFHIEQACIRGTIVTRNCLRSKGDSLIPDVLPCDSRYVVYELDMEGYAWVGHKTTRSKAMIKAEYGKDIKGDTGTVWDVWTRTKNSIWIDREQVKEQANPYSKAPFTIVECPTGSSLGDADARSHRGESLLALSRETYDWLNQIMTIYVTRGRAALRPGLQYQSDEGESSKKPSDLEFHPADSEVITPVEKGGGYFPVQQVGIDQGIQHAWAILDSRKQQGSFTQVDYGNLTFPLPDVALGRLMEQHNQITLPILQALAIAYQQNAEMWIEQYKMLDKGFRIGEAGQMRVFRPSDLKGDFTIKRRYFATSPELDMTNYSIAAAAGDMISADRKRRDVLKLKDPTAEAQQIRRELAEKMDPIIALKRQLWDLIDAGENEDAWLTFIRLKQLIRQSYQPPAPEPGPTPEISGKGVPAPASVENVPMTPKAVQQGAQTRQPKNKQLMEALNV